MLPSHAVFGVRRSKGVALRNHLESAQINIAPVHPASPCPDRRSAMRGEWGVLLAARPGGGVCGKDGCMLDHLSIQCADVHASAAFYDAALGALSGTRVMDFGTVIGFGTAGKPEFWIGPQTTGEGFRESHIAFAAPGRAAVRAFFAAAAGTGAQVLHEPRLWPEYHASYYGAFVRDPDGNNVEAVCHAPE